MQLNYVHREKVHRDALLLFSRDFGSLDISSQS